MKAYDLFCLCNNYDNAAKILISNLAIAYQNNATNKERLLQKAQQFKTEVQMLPSCDIAPLTASSLDVLLQLIDIMMLVDRSKRCICV